VLIEKNLVHERGKNSAWVRVRVRVSERKRERSGRNGGEERKQEKEGAET
jgi:hypothetical protein